MNEKARRENVRREALYCVNKHLNMGCFASTRDQFDVFERVVAMVQQIMVIESPESVVVRESPKARGSGATTHMYGLMLDRLEGLNRVRDLCSSRGLLPPRMIVLKMDDVRPANNAIGLVHMPADEDSAAQGVVVWISCQLKVTVMGVRALPSFCDGYTEDQLEADQVKRLFGTGFDNYVLNNLGVLVGSLGEARNNLRRAQYGQDALVV